MTIFNSEAATQLTLVVIDFVVDNMGAVLAVVGIVVGINMVRKMLSQALTMDEFYKQGGFYDPIDRKYKMWK